VNLMCGLCAGTAKLEERKNGFGFRPAGSSRGPGTGRATGQLYFSFFVTSEESGEQKVKPRNVLSGFDWQERVPSFYLT